MSVTVSGLPSVWVSLGQLVRVAVVAAWARGRGWGTAESRRSEEIPFPSPPSLLNKAAEPWRGQLLSLGGTEHTCWQATSSEDSMATGKQGIPWAP